MHFKKKFTKIGSLVQKLQQQNHSIEPFSPHRVLFTPPLRAQTSKGAKWNKRAICGLDKSTIPHTHFLDGRHPLTSRRKEHVPQELQGKGVTLGMNFWTTPWSYPKLPRKKMTHIKDIRFHPLVSGFARNRFLTI